jgi:hypothetical protein
MLTVVAGAGFEAAFVGLPCADATTEGTAASREATAAIVRTLRNIESSLKLGLIGDPETARICRAT